MEKGSILDHHYLDYHDFDNYYCYHIMYYVGSGLKGWQIKMDSKIRDDRLSADFETFKNKHKIDYNDSVINKVELEKTEESSGESSAANLANQ